MILITGTVIVAPENKAAFLAAASKHVTHSRGEDGCISHGVHEDAMAPGTFVFVERWRDMDAVKAHFAQAGSQAFMVEMRKLSSGGTGVEIHDVASTRVVK